MASRKLTDVDRVLIALAHASGGEQAPIPYEEIVIESWKRFPDRFSLRRHPEFPDSSDQHKKLYGPLKRSGYIVALRDKQFRLTDAGLERAAQLDRALSPSRNTAPGSRLGRDDERLVRAALSSEAYAKWRDGRADDISDFDARSFFGVTVTTAESNRRARVAAMDEALSNAESNGMVAASDLRLLSELIVSRYPNVTGLGAVRPGGD